MKCVSVNDIRFLKIQLANEENFFVVCIIQLQMSTYQEEESGCDVTIVEYAKLPADVSRFVCKQGDVHTV